MNFVLISVDNQTCRKQYFVKN